MKQKIKQSLTEASFILLAAVLLGLLYTAIFEKGIFAPPKNKKIADTTSQSLPELEMISKDKALEFHTSGTAIFIDSRYKIEFDMGHIKGAINIPLNEFEQKKDVWEKIPFEKNLILYCDGAQCNSSIELALKFLSIGFKNVKVFFGGWSEWQMNNLPIEK